MTPRPYVLVCDAFVAAFPAVCAAPKHDQTMGYQWIVRDEKNPYLYTHAGQVYATEADARAALDEHLSQFPWHRPFAEILRAALNERDGRE